MTRYRQMLVVLMLLASACGDDEAQNGDDPQDSGPDSNGSNGDPGEDPVGVVTDGPSIDDVGAGPCEPAEQGRTLWVDDVADSGDGSAAKPFNRIQAAADVVKPGDTVLIRGGVYRETVRVATSGTADLPITFRGCEGPVVISGADVVSGPWRPVQGMSGFYETELDSSFASELNQAEQAFVDGRMMIEARHPNVPFNSLDPMRARLFSVDGVEDGGITPGETEQTGWRRLRILDAEMQSPAGTWNDATVWVTARHGEVHGGGWGHRVSGRVVGQEPGSVVVDIPLSVEWKKLGPGEPYHLGQSMAALDAQGEWLHADGKLYLSTADGTDPGEHLVEIKRRDYAFNLTDQSHLVLQDLSVFGATITTDHNAGNYGQGGGSHVTQRGRKSVAPSENVTLASIHAKYINHFVDMTGWAQGQWVQTSGIVLSGRGHTLRDSFIEYSAGNGVLVIGERHRVTNNLVHDTNYTGVFAAAICMGMESLNRDIEVDHNTVWATGFDGIMTQRLVSSAPDQARIHHNRVSAFGLMTRDVGAIKIVGHDPAANGTRWDHNVVSDGGAWAYGLYWDFATGWIADHNVAFATYGAFNVNDGIDHQIYNNTLLGRTYSIESATPLQQVHIQNNILSHAVSASENSGNVNNNLIDPELDLFVKPGLSDFRLQSSAASAIDQGIALAERFTADAVGKPDLGAYEHGTDAWRVGASLQQTTVPPTSLAAVRNPDGSASLSWKDRDAGEDYYYVERALRDNELNWLQWNVIAELPADSEAYTDQSPEAYQHGVYYRVRADHSMLSNTVALLPTSNAARWALDQDLSDSASDDIIDDTASYLSQGAETSPRFSTAEKASGSASLEFDAAQRNLLKVPSSAEITPIDEITFLMWVKPTSYISLATYATKYSGAAKSGFSLSQQFNDITVRIGYGHAKLEGIKPPENQWTLLVLTYKPVADGGLLKLYFGDTSGKLELVSEKEIDNQLLFSTQPLHVGGMPNESDSQRYFTGQIDDIRLYTTAMDAEEIRALL